MIGPLRPRIAQVDMGLPDSGGNIKIKQLVVNHIGIDVCRKESSPWRDHGEIFLEAAQKSVFRAQQLRVPHQRGRARRQQHRGDNKDGG